MRTHRLLVALSAVLVGAVLPGAARATAPSHGRFVGTTTLVDATGTDGTVANAACQLEFGAGYRVADWRDVEAFFRTSSEASQKEFYIDLGIKPYGSYGSVEQTYLVSLDGREIAGGIRHYFLARHDHTLPTTYTFFVHATINANELDLGSWYFLLPALCYRM